LVTPFLEDVAVIPPPSDPIGKGDLHIEYGNGWKDNKYKWRIVGTKEIKDIGGYNKLRCVVLYYERYQGTLLSMGCNLLKPQSCESITEKAPHG